MRTIRNILFLACIGLGTAAFGTASAQGHDASPPLLPIALPDALPDTSQYRTMPAVSTNTDWTDTDAMGTPIDTARLDALRGGDGSVDNEVILQGTVTDNTADHVLSGPNAISDGAFANAAGINTAIQNTGSNVLIQNGMVVNIQFVAPTP